MTTWQTPYSLEISLKDATELHASPSQHTWSNLADNADGWQESSFSCGTLNALQGLRVEGADEESDVPGLVRFPAGTDKIIQLSAGEQ